MPSSSGGPRLAGSGSWRVSSEGLEVGSHHVGDPADLGEFPEIVERVPLPLDTVLERLHGPVQPDLVPVLETVGDGLRGRVDAALPLEGDVSRSLW
jgi:hypothetical protein